MSTNFIRILKIATLVTFSLTVSLVAFLFLELISSILVSNNLDRLQDILRLLQQDSVLFWKQKSNLDTEFQNQKVVTNNVGFRCHNIKEKNKKRIVCLGASPTFGWGVKYEDTYPVVIEKILKENNIDIEVINAGEIGYSSYQGLNLLKNKILDLKPDIITVSYVINDIDKYRFFRSSILQDNQLKPISKIFITISNIAQESNFFKLIKQIVKNNISKKVQYYGKNCNNQYNENRRVSMYDYEANLKEFIKIAKENNIKIFFIVMPVNLPKKKIITEEEKKEIDLLFKDFYNEFKQKKYTEAKDILSRILLIDKYNTKMYYYLGILAEKENNIEFANEYFKKAKNYEIFDCASISLKYNDIMRKVAYNNKVDLCDCAKEFFSYDGDYLFVDPKYDCFHPNNKGHKIIATTVVKNIINYLKEAKYV